MELIYVPDGWREVSEDMFEGYLKTCPDYTRRSYTGKAIYAYRHNGQNFAVLDEDKVYVRPDILSNE